MSADTNIRNEFKQKCREALKEAQKISVDDPCGVNKLQAIQESLEAYVLKHKQHFPHIAACIEHYEN